MLDRGPWSGGGLQGSRCRYGCRGRGWGRPTPCTASLRSLSRPAVPCGKATATRDGSRPGLGRRCRTAPGRPASPRSAASKRRLNRHPAQGRLEIPHRRTRLQWPWSSIRSDSFSSPASRASASAGRGSLGPAGVRLAGGDECRHPVRRPERRRTAGVDLAQRARLARRLHAELRRPHPGAVEKRACPCVESRLQRCHSTAVPAASGP